MDLRITSERGHDTITTTVDGVSFERREEWSIHVIEGLPDAAPASVHDHAAEKDTQDEGWTTLECTAGVIALAALLVYGW